MPPLTSREPQAHDPDGLPVLAVTLPLAREGHVQWLVPDVQRVLGEPYLVASDGARVAYLTWSVNRDPVHDLLIRDGSVYTDVIRQLGGDSGEHVSCAAADAGNLVIVTHTDDAGMRAWHLAASGEVRRFDLDLSSSPNCDVHVDPSGHFVVQAGRVALWSGQAVSYAPDPTPPGFRSLGPPACAGPCDPFAARPETVAFARVLREEFGMYMSVQRHDRWLLAWGGDTVARATLDRPCCGHERLDELPLPYGSPPALTARGSVVIPVAPRAEAYRVWPVDAAEPSPPRNLADDAILVLGNPALLLRGLPAPIERTHDTHLFGPIPEAFHEPWSRNHFLTGDPPPRLARATALFGARASPVETTSAGIDLRCGGVVWPASGAVQPDEIVLRPDRCTPLASVLQPVPEVATLLAVTTRGELLITWRMPQVGDRSADPDPTRAEPPPPTPVEWSILGDVDRLDGPITDEPSGAPEAPGTRWRRAGATTLQTRDHTVVLHGDLVFALPRDAVPLALGRQAIAARGAKLVVCDPACVEVDPGIVAPPVAAFHSAARGGRLVAGYADGRLGVVDPAAPRTTLTDPPVALALRAALARKRDAVDAFFTAHGLYSKKPAPP